MSDYLDNLADRSLNLAPLVQPRPMSIFEPVPLSSTPPNNSVEAEPESATQPLLSVQSQRFMPDSAHHDFIEAPNLSTRSSVLVSERAIADRNRDRDWIEPHDTERLFLRPGRSPNVIAPSPSMFDPVKQIEPPAEEVPVRRAAEIVTRRQAVANSDPALSSSTMPVDWRLFEGRIGRIIDERISSIERSPTRGHLRSEGDLPESHPEQSFQYSPGQREPIVRTVLSQRVAEPATLVAPPPAIRVTIGRVDVKAIIPQPTLQRPARAARPVTFSLDDYLKQRSGGQR